MSPKNTGVMATGACNGAMPNAKAPHDFTGVLEEDEEEVIHTIRPSLKARLADPQQNGEVKGYKGKGKVPTQLVWRNINIFIFFHIGALYGAKLLFGGACMWQTVVFTILMYLYSGWGITAGAHRLWAHKSYKARLPLRIFLAIGNSIAFQNSIFEWSRDHRVHHKYSETDADPHNAVRGFFFAHMGWLLCKKHPDVKGKGGGIGMQDLRDDPVVDFQDRHYMILMPLFCFVMPTLVPWLCWGESPITAYFVPAMLRFILVLHATWLVNSAAHLIGNQPYDKFINPAENRGVALAALGEGWHNYHHVFPWDYKTAELGNYRLNFTTAFIDFCYKVGLAYDLKTVDPVTIQKRVLRTGDGTHPEHATWGWGDPDIKKEDVAATNTINSEISAKYSNDVVKNSISQNGSSMKVR